MAALSPALSAGGGRRGRAYPLLIALLVAAAAVAPSAATLRTLRVAASPAAETAAVPWAVQPAVQAMYRDDFGAWHGDGTGWVGVGGAVRAYLLPADDADADVYRYAVATDAPPLATAPLVGGWANFSGLVVAAADTFRLQLVVPGVAGAVTPPFVVAPGPPARYALLVPPSTATGSGLPFRQQPKVGVIDAGGNMVTSVAAGAVTFTASLLLANGSGATLAGGAPRSVPLAAGGVATFSGLAVDAAGSGYVLRFTAVNATGAVAAIAPAHVDSPPFSVGVGPTAALVVVTQPGGGAGGSPLRAQPVVELRDAGGNVNVADSDSTVTASLWADPSTAASGRGGGGASTLGPAYAWVLLAGLNASVSAGSSVVTVTGNATATTAGLGPNGWGAPLVGRGDWIGLGWPAWTGGAREALGDAVVQQQLLLAAAAVAAVAASNGSAGAGGHPALGSAGRLVRYSVACPAGTMACPALPAGGGAGFQLVLDAPWDGPPLANATLWQVRPGLTARVVAGRASFTGLTLDRAGAGYRLLFTSSLTNATAAAGLGWGDVSPSSYAGPYGVGHGRTGFGYGYGTIGGSGAVATVSAPLKVTTGAPFRLALLRPAGGAWAGNQPFGVQPAVSLVDAGENVITTAHRRVAGAVAAAAYLVVTTTAAAAGVAPSIANASSRYAHTLALLDSAAGVVPVEEGVAEFTALGVSLTSAALAAAAAGAGVPLADVRVLLEFTWVSPPNTTTTTLPPPLLTPLSPAVPGGAVLNASHLLDVPQSAEWALVGFSGGGSTASVDPAAGLPRAGDRFGHAVAASRGLAVVSALYAETPQLQEEVQLVRVSAPPPPVPDADAAGFVPEVQVVTLAADWRPEVQAVTLAAVNASATLSGTVTLSWGGRTTRPLQALSDPGWVQAVVAEDLLPLAGGPNGGGLQGDATVDVATTAPPGSTTRSLAAAGGGGGGGGGGGVHTVTWTLTFSNVYGDVPLLGVDASALAASAGSNATAVVTRLQAATVVGGSFTLAMPAPDSEAARNPAAASNASAACPAHHPAGAGEAVTAAAAACVPRLYVTRPLPHDVDAATLGAAIQVDLRAGGPVRVDYVGPLVYADNAYFGWGVGLRAWRVTFTPGPHSYDVPTLQPNASGLAGSGAPVVEVTTLRQGVGPLDGAFRLAVGGAATAPIPLNATGAYVQAALLAVAPTLVVAVTRRSSSSDASLTSTSSAVMTAAVEWEVRIARNVTRSWPGDGQEDDYGYNGVDDGSGSGELRALFRRPPKPRLAVMGAADGGSAGGYAWLPAGADVPPDRLYGTGARVTVVSLSASSSDAAGSDGTVDTGLQSGAVYVYTRSSPEAGWQPAQRLDPPTSDGATGARVSVEYSLFGHAVALSTKPGNASAPFNGSSSAVGNGVLVVSAPGARDDGRLEVQSLTCNSTPAVGGSLRFTFAGATTAWLPPSSTGADLRNALEGLPTLRQVLVSPAEVPLCGNTAAVNGSSNTAAAVTYITFVWPQDGDMPPLVVETNGTATTTPGGGGGGGEVAFITDDVVRGTRKASGDSPSGAATGCVLVYGPAVSNSSGGGVNTTTTAAAAWTLTATLTPPAADVATQSIGYGWSVAATVHGAGGGGGVHTVAVGAPFHASDGGLVYVYNADAGEPAATAAVASPYTLLQALSADTHNSAGGPGYRFGWAVAFASEGDTLLVGAPGADGGAGAVWAFKRQPDAGALFFIDQLLRGAAAAAAAVAGVLSRHVSALTPRAFGHSVAVAGTAAVVGAPDTDVTWQLGASHGGSNAIALPRAAAGAAYVYDRLGWGEEGGYLHLRAVVASELAAAGDRLGVSVAAADNVAVVGLAPDAQSANPNGVAGRLGTGQDRPGQPYPVQPPPHEVQWVTLTLNCTGRACGGAEDDGDGLANATLAGYFTLSWRRATADDGSVPVTSRRLPWNASPTLVRRALEGDLATGRVHVTRHVRGDTGDGTAALLADGVVSRHVYTWAVTFLEQPSTSAQRRYGDGSASVDRSRPGKASTPTYPLPLLSVAGGALRLRPLPGSVNGSAPSLDAAALDAASLADAAALASDPALVLGDSAVARALGASTDVGGRVLSPWKPRVSVYRVNEAAAPWPAATGGALVLTRDYATLPPPAPADPPSYAATGYGAQWVQQALLLPHAYQPLDGYGAAVAFEEGAGDGSALVGAPSRKLLHGSVLPGVNAGAAFAYELGFLNVRAARAVDVDDADSAAAVAEGSGAQGALDATSSFRHLPPSTTLAHVAFTACATVCVVAPAGNLTELYATVAAGDDWGVYAEMGVGGPPAGALAARADAAPATSLYAHSGSSSEDYDGYPCGPDSNGTAECVFRGRRPASGVAYDDSGATDFVPPAPAPMLLELGPAVPSAAVDVLVTQDAVLEAPRGEHFHVRASLPGMRPLWGGGLWTTVAITDDGDGTVDGVPYLQRIDAATAAAATAAAANYTSSPLGGFGASVATDGTYALVGAPSAACFNTSTSSTKVADSCGAVTVLRFNATAGGWVPHATLSAPAGTAAATDGARFGAAVALLSQQSTALRVAAVAAPGTTPPTVTLLSLNASTGAWAHAVTLAPQTTAQALAATLVRGRDFMPHPLSPAHACGAAGALSVSVDDAGGLLVALGCAGTEAVFVFRDSGPAGGGETAAVAGPHAARWQQTVVLRASDYASAVVNGVGYARTAASFGSAVSLSGHTLAVGAPGWSKPTAAADAAWHGQQDAAADTAHAAATGAVFVFHYVPGVSTADYAPHGARPVNWTALAGWAAADLAVSRGLAVGVYDDASGDGMWAQQARLVAPRQPGGGGGGSGSADAAADAAARHRWEAFGAALHLHDAALIVGAPGRSLPPPGNRAELTWDFESGDLRGWTPTGNAFARQPTAGDNPACRPEYADVLGGLPRARSRHGGRFWVSSYDVHPADGGALQSAAQRERVALLSGVADGAGTDGVPESLDGPPDVTASSRVPCGTVQGDAPVGTLTSPPFIIGGGSGSGSGAVTISLLVGGGCDERRVYVELRVDGATAARATGSCSEELLPVTWDVNAHAGHVGVIRVVDDSSTSPWGHIAVDSVAFSWDTGSPAVAAAGAGVGSAFVYTRVTAPGEPYGGVRGTTTSGDVAVDAAAQPAEPRGGPYLSERCPSAGMDHPPLECVWQLDAELRARVPTPHAGFGGAVAIDDDSGIAVVATVEGGATEGERDGTDALSEAGSAPYASDDDVAASYRALRVPPPLQQLAVHPQVTRSSLGGAHAALFSASGGGTSSSGLAAPASPAHGSGSSSSSTFYPDRHGGGHHHQRRRLLLHVFRSEPQYRGGAACNSGCGPLVRPRLWAGHPHTTLRPPAGGLSAAAPALPPAVALSRFGVLAGVPSSSGGGIAWWADLAYTLLSLDARDVTAAGVSGAAQTARTDNFAQDAYLLGGLGAHVTAYSVLENATTANVAVPVYRHGWRDGSRMPFAVSHAPQALLAGRTLHVQFATSDGTARGVSPRRAAECARLPREARHAAGCGHYVATAGTLTFPPGSRVAAAVVPLVDDACYEGGSGSGSRTFDLQLYLPGGPALDGYGYRVTVTIVDDDGPQPAAAAGGGRPTYC